MTKAQLIWWGIFWIGSTCIAVGGGVASSKVPAPLPTIGLVVGIVGAVIVLVSLLFGRAGSWNSLKGGGR